MNTLPAIIVVPASTAPSSTTSLRVPAGHPAALWLANLRRERTREEYARTFYGFGMWLHDERGKADPLLADFADLLAYREYMEQPDPAQRGGKALAVSTQRKRLAALASFYAFAVARGALSVSPLAGLRLPKRRDKRARRVWTLEEFGAFMAAISTQSPQESGKGSVGSLRALRDRALFGLIFRNGLRVSEACGSNIGDLVVKSGLRVLELREHGADDQHVKGGDWRDAVLKANTSEALDAYLRARGFYAGAELPGAPGVWRDWPLFIATHAGGRRRRVSRNGDGDGDGDGEGVEDRPASATGLGLPAGRRMTRQAVWARIREIGSVAGIDPELLTPHKGRHLFAMTLIGQHVPLNQIQQATGHASLAGLQPYIEAEDNLANNAAWKIPY